MTTVTSASVSRSGSSNATWPSMYAELSCIFSVTITPPCSLNTIASLRSLRCETQSCGTSRRGAFIASDTKETPYVLPSHRSTNTRHDCREHSTSRLGTQRPHRAVSAPEAVRAWRSSYAFVLSILDGGPPQRAVGPPLGGRGPARRQVVHPTITDVRRRQRPEDVRERATIALASLVGEMLTSEKPLHVQPEDFVFLNPEGRPIDVKVFTQWTWNPALRRLNIRPRKFYATRHTFISLPLSRGWNLKALAQYSGTSVT